MVTTSRENVALVRQFLADVVAGGDTDAVDVFLAEDVADLNLVLGDEQGREAVAALGWQGLAAAAVDLEIETAVATDETVALRATVTGTHRESLMDLTPTGRSFEITYVWFCRIDDGRIAEIWSLLDGLGFMQRLGAIPEVSSNRSLTQPTEHQ